MKLPGEDENRPAIEMRLRERLDLARRLLAFWLEDNKDRELDRSRLPHETLQLAIGLNVKSCRQYRNSVELYRRGEAEDAELIVRSMFEGLLAQAFLLVPRFRLRVLTGGKLTKPINAAGLPLTRRHRARAYAAHLMRSRDYLINRIAVTPGTKRIGKSLARKSDPALLKRLEHWVGIRWWARISSRPYTYSGLSIANLARSLGSPFSRYYDTVYSRQSEHVHSVDPDDFLSVDDEVVRPKWQSCEEDVIAGFDISTDIFMSGLLLLTTEIPLSPVMRMALGGLKHENDEIRKSC